LHNLFTDILVVFNLHTCVFFQLSITLHILGTFFLKLLMQLEMRIRRAKLIIIFFPTVC
jgi:hypothetical protein